MSRNFTAAENERQRKRNISRKINDVTDYLMKKFSTSGEHFSMTQGNAEEAARSITSEVFGFNTADLETPVDEEACQTAEDIIAQIKAKSAANRKRKDATNEELRKDMFGDIRKMADVIMDTTPAPINEFFEKVDETMSNQQHIDPFEAAMSVVGKK